MKRFNSRSNNQMNLTMIWFSCYIKAQQNDTYKVINFRPQFFHFIINSRSGINKRCIIHVSHPQSYIKLLWILSWKIVCVKTAAEPVSSLDDGLDWNLYSHWLFFKKTQQLVLVEQVSRHEVLYREQKDQDGCCMWAPLPSHCDVNRLFPESWCRESGCAAAVALGLCLWSQDAI